MMHEMTLSPRFRAATINDCTKIAELFSIASDGVSDYIWSTLMDQYPGLTPLEIGAKRYANEESVFSYKNCVIAEQMGKPIGMMLTFSATGTEDLTKPAEPDLTKPDLAKPDVLTPESLEAPGTWQVGNVALFPQLREQDIAVMERQQPIVQTDPLELDVLAPYNLEAPGTWYICALALFPEFRGQGIGTQFLSIAHQQAAEQGFSELSLLCFEQNTGALKLYQRNGFTVINRTPVVPHPLIHHTGDILLMTAPVQI